jgi:surfeit locus 1 family protein
VALARAYYGAPVRRASASAMSSANKGFEKGWLVFGGIVCATGALGAWQIQRYFWKKELIEGREKSLLSDPVAWHDLPRSKEVVTQLQYCPVTVTGVFDHGNEVFVGPRSPPKERVGGMGLASVNGETSGYYVVTPFLVRDGSSMTGEKILVNRGWIPASFLVNGKRVRASGESVGGLGGEAVNVVGVFTPGEKRHFFSPPNDVGTRRFLWFEMEQLNQACHIDDAPTAHSILSCTSQSGPTSGDVPLCKTMDTHSEFHTGPNTHLIYSGTWFTLAAFGTYMTKLRFRR